MKKNSLDEFIGRVRGAWGPFNSDLAAKCREYLRDLAKASESEAWLTTLLGSPKDTTELYRDPDHGFILLAHTENRGLYRAPHDHGNGWVIYAVQSGEMEMADYDNRDSALSRRDIYRLARGQARTYFPGDIHHTECISESVLQFRFTSCDLKREMKEGRMRRWPLGLGAIP